MIVNRETNHVAQCAPHMPRPDDRYSRDIKKDFFTCLEKWFDFVESIKKDNLHPESFYALFRFIKEDLNR